MSQSNRFELGPLLMLAGAVLLLVSLFVEWFEPGLTAWAAFELLDLVLAGMALVVLLAALGLLAPGWGITDAERVPLVVAAALAIVAVQLLDPPPIAGDGSAETGAWIALAATFLMAAGALLAFGRLRLQVSFEGRDPRRRVSAVDARPHPSEEGRGSLFGSSSASPTQATTPMPASERRHDDPPETPGGGARPAA